MTDRPHVVRVITSFGVGGVQKQLTRVTPLLTDKGYRITVLALEKEGPLRATFEDKGIPTKVLPLKGKYRLGEILKLAWWLARSNCLILHIHRMGGVLFPSVMAGTIAGVKAIVVHHHFPYTWENRRKRTIEAAATKMAQRVIGVSHHVGKTSTKGLGLSPQRIETIYNGIEKTEKLPTAEARKQLRLPAKALVCGMVVRIVYFKRIQDAIEAIAEVSKRWRSALLAIVGGGEPKRIERLKKQVRMSGTEAAVSWCGEIEEAASLMKAFNLGMLVSTKEGLANTVLEYWNAGLPIVISNIPPNWEMVSTGGVLVPPKSPHAVAKAVETILSSPRLSSNLAQRGKQRVKRFSIQATANATTSLYRSLLSS